MRRFMRLAAVGLIVIFVAGYFLLFPPFPRIPELGRGLPSQTASETFEERVRAALPLPAKRDDVVSRLAAEGFDVDAEGEAAQFEKTRFPCTLIWQIWWETDGDFVTEISAMHGSRCL